VIRYVLFAVIKLCGVLAAWLFVNPFLPLFEVPKKGWVNNKDHIEVEFFLPDWLYWFSTNADNSLWGDEAHRQRHPDFNSYWAKLCWLYRNPFKGADWTILGAPVNIRELKQTANGYSMGSYFLIVLPNNFKFGWEIDAYANGRTVTEPKAAFVLGR